MKTFNSLFYVIALICCFSSHLIARGHFPSKFPQPAPTPIQEPTPKPTPTPKPAPIQELSPIKSLNFSLWSEYKRDNFTGMTQEEKTEKLQKIFKDKLAFVQKHGIRRLIIKIMDPASFDFFHPNHFNPEQEDNFYFWACQLVNHVHLEALFDCASFHFNYDSIFDRLVNYYNYLRDYIDQQEFPFGYFQNIIEKMEWVAWTNEIYGAQIKNYPLISGITLDPKGIGHSDAYYQNLVNAFDQFRFQKNYGNRIPEWIPENTFSGLKIGMLLPLDMKDFAIANASRFPLTTDMSAHLNSNELGITLPKNFPSESPRFERPSWRAISQTEALLDTVYLNMGDPRLISCLYQNYLTLPHPDQPASFEVIEKLNEDMQKVFLGKPFIKGIGYITNNPSSTQVKGLYTFFQTGNSYGEGQFMSDNLIELRPPFVEESIVRSIVNTPNSNREMHIDAPFSTTHAVENVEYWKTPIPCNWSKPKLSNQLRSKIYFVFSSTCDSEKNKFFGNWNLKNFLSFISGNPTHIGFLQRPLFFNLDGQLVSPNNNLVLYDFSTLPNGHFYPQVNWNLGNQNY